MEAAGDLSLSDSFGKDQGLDHPFFCIINIPVDFLFHLVYLYSNWVGRCDLSLFIHYRL